MKGEIVLAASPRREITGSMIRLTEPFSFWGGVDQSTAVIFDRRSHYVGSSMAHSVLAIQHLRGSSSSSAVLLELIHRDLAPAAIILSQVDAILVLGAIVGRELGWATPLVMRLSEEEFRALDPNSNVCIDASGE